MLGTRGDRERMRATPASGTRSQSGRCASLVFDLVEGLFQEKEVEQPVGVGRRSPATAAHRS